jgi:biopolymer transport protein ExbD
MSEVQVKEQGGGKKARQKKQTLRVDFTPMVDMNMLLITFFMFCTTLLKPQVMNIAMPSTEKAEEGQELTTRESTAITILMGENDKIFYYEGKLEDKVFEDSTFLKETTYGEEGIRQILLRKNEGTYQKIQELKGRRDNGEIDAVMFDSLSNKIQKDANDILKIAPTILIKPLDKSSYKNMVDILDEMLITNIGFYQIAELVDGDRYLYFKRTGDQDVLSPAQKAQLDKSK